MLELKDISTNNLAFDINDKNFVKKLESRIPEFKNYKGEIDKKNLFSYIVLMYDRQTPMRKECPNYFERKFESARLSGFKFKRKGQVYEEGVEKSILGYDHDANELVAAYIAYFSDPKYYELQSLLFLRDEMARDMFNGKIDKKNDHKTMSEISQKIDDLTKMLFYSGEEDELYELKKKLYAKADSDRKMPTPENVADYLNEEGDVPDDYNPFNGYKPEPMKFIGDSEECADKMYNRIKNKEEDGKKRKTKKG